MGPRARAACGGGRRAVRRPNGRKKRDGRGWASAGRVPGREPRIASVDGRRTSRSRRTAGARAGRIDEAGPLVGPPGMEDRQSVDLDQHLALLEDVLVEGLGAALRALGPAPPHVVLLIHRASGFWPDQAYPELVVPDLGARVDARDWLRAPFPRLELARRDVLRLEASLERLAHFGRPRPEAAHELLSAVAGRLERHSSGRMVVVVATTCAAALPPAVAAALGRPIA